MKNFTLWSGRVLGLLLTTFALNAQAQFCDESQGAPGFPSDPACEAAVCSADPFCCSTAWDQGCATGAAATPECSGCLSSAGGPLCDAEPIDGVTPCDYDTASAAYSIVVSDDPFCCNTAWDSLCQDVYLGLGGTPNPDPACNGGNGCVDVISELVDACDFDPNSLAYQATIADDPFCCDTAWDSVCQSNYVEIFGGGPNPDPSCGENCFNGSGFGTVTLANTDVLFTISTCQFQSEYSTVNGVLAGETYVSNYSVDDASSGFITVREGAADGPVVASGFAPLTWTANISDTHFVHYNADEDCSTSSFCGLSTIQCTTCDAASVGNACEDSQAIACGDVVSGTTLGAPLFTLPFCGTTDGSGGTSFYTFIGTGETVTANLCDSDFDTKIWVFEGGDCDNLICVGGNDDFCGLQSQFTWESVEGVSYFVIVGGFGGSQGEYTLEIECSDVPAECTAVAPECVTDQAAYEFVIAEDPFCCNNSWDDICQLSYDEISSTCIVNEGGCTYPTACNFNPQALFDDGSCEFISCAGCTYPDALNFNPMALFDDGSCVFDPSDCVDNCPGDFNNDNIVNTSDLLTFLSVFGTICE